MNRRDFMRTASGLAAAGGGLVLLGKGDAAVAAGEPAAHPLPLLPQTPKRLSDATRALAERAISGEHGRGMRNADFSLDESAVEGMSRDMRYAVAAKLIAEKAPLRVLPGEKIVGSATLLEGPMHMTPVAGVPSISHTTVGFHRVLPLGYGGLKRQIEERLARGDLDDKGKDLLAAMTLCLEAADTWHRRNIELLGKLAAESTGEDRDNYLSVIEAYRDVPGDPPKTFHQAVQSLWSMWAFHRLLGNWSGIGRIDDMLGPYLKADLEAGRLTVDEAREILAHFWIKGCEWIGALKGRGSGDAQHYQNIILSGVNAAGEDVTNEVTYLVLDIVEELHISDFPIAVRINRDTPEKLLRRVAEVQRHGGGIVALYNEEVAIDGLVEFGYPVEEARTFANDGCWELLIPGRTTFSYVPFDALAILHGTLGLHDGTQPPPEFATFDDLYAAFLRGLSAQVDSHNAVADGWASDGHPCPFISLFVEDCVERGRGYYDRGSRYTVLAPHAGGMANVANSLLAIRKLVYEDGTLALPEFVRILRSDWEGHEPLRRWILSRIPSYGNDDDEADAMVARLFDDYTELVGRVKERNGVLRPAGISTFGREIEWSKPEAGRRASPDGHHRGEVLATNLSPSPGTDKAGPTAVLKSYCKMDFTRLPNNGTVELKVHPDTVKGEAGVRALVALSRSLVDLGGMFMHVDVVDSELLRDAQRNPDKYPNLAVRVAGWSARFATLNEDWQNMVINRTQQMC